MKTFCFYNILRFFVIISRFCNFNFVSNFQLENSQKKKRKTILGKNTIWAGLLKEFATFIDFEKLFSVKNRYFHQKKTNYNVLRNVIIPAFFSNFVSIWWNNNIKFRREQTANVGVNAVGKHRVQKRNHVLNMEPNQNRLLWPYVSSCHPNATKLYLKCHL